MGKVRAHVSDGETRACGDLVEVEALFAELADVKALGEGGAFGLLDGTLLVAVGKGKSLPGRKIAQEGLRLGLG